MTKILKRWEYKILTETGGPVSTGTLTTLGAEGWELVSVVRIEGAAYTKYDYYFKRPF